MGRAKKARSKSRSSSSEPPKNESKLEAMLTEECKESLESMPKEITLGFDSQGNPHFQTPTDRPKRPKSIFNDPAFQSLWQSLDDDTKNYYRKIGENLYNTVNFEGSDSEAMLAGGEGDPIQLHLHHIEAGFRSGLMPSDLEEGEVAFLEKERGDEWWKYYGFESPKQSC